MIVRWGFIARKASQRTVADLFIRSKCIEVWIGLIPDGIVYLGLIENRRHGLRNPNGQRGDLGITWVDVGERRGAAS